MQGYAVRLRIFVKLLAPAGILGMLVLMLREPGAALKASLEGLAIWWDVLFPSLLPFFVVSELMLGLGVERFFGTLLDPMMRPLFRVPGIGGFVMAMGFASGYPVGARLTSQLWEQGLIRRVEGERLVAFTTSSDPIFLIGAVSVGFFGAPELAAVLVVAHYGAGLLVGLVMRFYGRKEERAAESSDRGIVAQGGNRPRVSPQPRRRSGLRAGLSLLVRAFEAMHRARLADPRPIGKLAEDAVLAALRLIFVIGGLVVVFSVIMELLRTAGVMRIFHEGIAAALQRVGFPDGLSEALTIGLFEVTLGCKAAAAGEGAPIHRAAAAVWVLSWAGWSVHAQIVSLLSHAGFRYAPFAFARLLHAFLATALVYALWEPLAPAAARLAAALPASVPQGGAIWVGWGASAGALAFAATIAAIAGLYAVYRALLGFVRLGSRRPPR